MRRGPRTVGDGARTRAEAGAETSGDMPSRWCDASAARRGGVVRLPTRPPWRAFLCQRRGEIRFGRGLHQGWVGLHGGSRSRALPVSGCLIASLDAQQSGGAGFGASILQLR